MNIEYTTNTIVQGLYKAIEKNFRNCEVSEIKLLITDFKYNLCQGLSAETDSFDNEEEYSKILYRNNTVRLDKFKYDYFEVLTLNMYNNLRICVKPCTGITKFEKKKHKTAFYPLFSFFKRHYEVIERNIIMEYEIEFTRTGNSKTKTYPISQIEYMNMLQTYHRAVEEYKLKKEYEEQESANREITREISKMLDSLNIEKQIQ